MVDGMVMFVHPVAGMIGDMVHVLIDRSIVSMDHGREV